VSRAAVDDAVSTAEPRWGISGIAGPLGIAGGGREPFPLALRDAAVVGLVEPTKPAMALGPHDSACTEPQPRRRMTWAELMRRVFALDVLECPVCRGPMKIIAEITEPEVIERFLAALDLPTEHPEIEPARPPPQLELPLDDTRQESRSEAMDEGA
jgi:hypothetical protein